MSGVDSSVILVNLTNDTKIANKAIVTGISSSGTQSPSQGNVHHMIMPASNLVVAGKCKKLRTRTNGKGNALNLDSFLVESRE